jgi:nucleoid-associated protein YgaU
LSNTMESETVFEAIREYVVKPDDGKRTRLQNFKEMIKGQPDMKPSEPKVTKTEGDTLRTSATHQVGKKDDWGQIIGANGRIYHYVTDDPANGDAAKLYVKDSDVELVRSGSAYTVMDKDSLSKIAKKVYGSASNPDVEAIYQANKRIIGKNKDIIFPGQILIIPYNTH